MGERPKEGGNGAPEENHMSLTLLTKTQKTKDKKTRWESGRGAIEPHQPTFNGRRGIDNMAFLASGIAVHILSGAMIEVYQGNIVKKKCDLCT